MGRKGEKIVKILMKRDGYTRKEAWDMYENARAEIMDAVIGTSCLDPEDVLAEELGLEPDYLFEFI